jgi:hypothetical protein
VPVEAELPGPKNPLIRFELAKPHKDVGEVSSAE